MDYILVGIFLIIIILSVFTKPVEPFIGQPFSFIRTEVYGWIPIAEKANELIAQWIPNIGWIWKINDQIIEFQRARKGIPPMNKINPSSLQVSVQAKPTAFIWK
jgi:hypothetical protein